MIKSYFLKYGSLLNKLEIKETLELKINISFTLHESYYAGEYFDYYGLYADRLTIMDNYIPTFQDWHNEENKQFPTIIDIYFTEGKNKDKLKKCKYIRNIFNQNIFSLISEECLEE
jgi:hypothetical protein